MKHNRKIIYAVGFIFSLPVALTYYINSSFLSSFVGEKLVSIIYTLSSIGSLIALVLSSKFLRRIGLRKFLLYIIFFDALSLLALVFLKSYLGIVLAFIMSISFNTLVVFSLDEFLKIFSENSSMGGTEGAYLAISNLAWIFAELTLGTFLGEFSFRTIYLVSFFIMSLFFLITLFGLRNTTEPKYDNIDTTKYVGNFFENISLFRAYAINLLLQFFYCWMVIYTPIYLSIHLGFSWKEIGLIFTIMLLPFSIIPFRLGEYADIVGERMILMFGFTIASLGTLSLFLIHEHNIFIWASLLFITRVGAASIEAMSDTYFFKHIQPENEEFIGVYRSTTPVAYIFGPLVAFLIFIFLPAFNYIYLVLGAIMLSGVYLSSTISLSDV